MMNFELIDNFIQVTVTGIAAFAAVCFSVHYQDRSCLILSFAYACIAMGTLFYVLHLAVTGETPQIFYVSEISWIAAYLFFLSLQIVRTEGMEVRFRRLPFLCAVLAGSAVVVDRMMGPSFLVTGIFAATLAAGFYLTVFRLQSGCKPRETDICLLISFILQISLYISSGYMRDYTRFNLYFAIDLTMTGSWMALLLFHFREVKGAEDDLY